MPKFYLVPERATGRHNCDKISDKDLTFKRDGQRMPRSTKTIHLDDNDACARGLFQIKQTLALAALLYSVHLLSGLSVVSAANF